MFTRISRFAALAATIAAGVTLAACTQTGTPSLVNGPQLQAVNPQALVGSVRFVGGSPDGGPVTILLDQASTIPNGNCGVTPVSPANPFITVTVNYKDITGYNSLPVGSYRVWVSSPTNAFLPTNNRCLKIVQGGHMSLITVGSIADSAAEGPVRIFIFASGPPTQAPFQAPLGDTGFEFFNADGTNRRYAYEVQTGSSFQDVCADPIATCGATVDSNIGPFYTPQAAPTAFVASYLVNFPAGATFTFYPNPSGTKLFPTSTTTAFNNIVVYAIRCFPATCRPDNTFANTSTGGILSFQLIGAVNDPNTP